MDTNTTNTNMLACVQQANLQILIEIRDFCEKHNLRYYLYCGTLLGCIRHKGFIPWDDDADVAMPLKDYREFLKLYPKDNERFAICSIDTDKRFDCAWAKLVMRGTVYYDSRYEEVQPCKEIGVDIYPFVGSYHRPVFARIQAILINLHKRLLRGGKQKLTSELKHREDRHPIVHKMVDIIPFPLKLAMFKGLRNILWIDPDKKNWIGSVDAASFIGKYSRNDWVETEQREFENELFTVPREYDKVLRAMYGNYMELPRPEDRVGHVEKYAICCIPGVYESRS